MTAATIPPRTDAIAARTPQSWTPCLEPIPHAWSRRVNTRLGSGVSFDEDEETHERLRRGMASDEGRWTTWRWTREMNDDDDDDEEY